MLFLLSLLKTSLEVGIVLVINKWMLTPKTHRMVQGGLDFPLSFLCLRETWSLGEAESCLQLIPWEADYSSPCVCHSMFEMVDKCCCMSLS